MKRGPKPKMTTVKKGKIYADFKTGLYGLAEIGRRHGVSESTVSIYITKRLKREKITYRH